MIFKCYICNIYKFWNKKKCYKVIVTSNDGSDELFTKKICKSCGDEISNVYETNKKISEMEAVDE